MEGTGLTVDKFVERIKKDAKSIRDGGDAISEKQMSTVLVKGLLKDFKIISRLFCNVLIKKISWGYHKS